MEEKFRRLLQKLRPNEERPELVSDPYSHEDMINEVSEASSQLSPEDVRKIHFLESSEGKMLENPASTAKGNFQILDKTREEVLSKLNPEEIPVNPLRKDALLMKELVKGYENTLENSNKGPYEPNLENVYSAHHFGKQGALNILNNPKNPLSKARLKQIKRLLGKKLPEKDEEVKPAKDLLDLLEE